MTAHRFHSSRPHHDITGIRRSGLTFADINGRKIEPMDSPYTFRTTMVLGLISACAVVTGFAWLIVR